MAKPTAPITEDKLAEILEPEPRHNKLYATTTTAYTIHVTTDSTSTGSRWSLGW